MRSRLRPWLRVVAGGVVRTDAAGATQEFTRHIAGLGMQFSVGAWAQGCCCARNVPTPVPNSAGYYLACCEASTRSRSTSVWGMRYSPPL